MNLLRKLGYAVLLIILVTGCRSSTGADRVNRVSPLPLLSPVQNQRTAIAPPPFLTNSYRAWWPATAASYRFIWGTNSGSHPWTTNTTSTNIAWSQIVPRKTVIYGQLITFDSAGRVIAIYAEERQNGWEPNAILVTWSPLIAGDLESAANAGGPWGSIALNVITWTNATDAEAAFFRLSAPVATTLNTRPVRIWNPAAQHYGL